MVVMLVSTLANTPTAAMVAVADFQFMIYPRWFVVASVAFRSETDTAP